MSPVTAYFANVVKRKRKPEKVGNRKARLALASTKKGKGPGWRVKAQRIGDHKGKVRQRAKP